MEAQFFEAQGILLQPGWLTECLAHIRSKGPATANLSTQALVNKVFQIFQHTDLRVCSIGCFPANVTQIRDEILAGPFVLQVDGIKNIGAPLETRMQEGSSRCLLLAVTDGLQQTMALEYKRVPDLKIAMRLGTKIVVRNVRVKEGMLLLLPDYVIVLGGSKGLVEQGEDGAGVGSDGGQGPLQPPPQVRGGPGGAAAATVAPARRQQQQAALPPPLPPAAPMQEIDPFGDDDINWADIDLPSYVAPPAAAAPLPTPSRNQHQQLLQQSGGSAPPLRVSPGQPGGRDQPAVISILEDDDKIEVDVPTRTPSSSQTSAVSLHSDSGTGGEGGGGGGNRGRGEASGGGGRGTFTAAVTFSSPGGSMSAMSSQGGVLDSSSQVFQQQQQQQQEGDPSSVEEGPYVHLADAQQQQQRYAGQEVRIKGVVTSVTGSKVTKKKGLHITVQIDDGSGSPMEVRLSEAMTRGVIGLSSEEFCALFARDPAAATDVANQARFKLAQIEGVFSVRLPPSTTVSTTEKGGNSNKLPLLTSCTSPTVSDVEALMKICANAIGYELPAGFGEGGKKQEVIDLIEIDDDD